MQLKIVAKPRCGSETLPGQAEAAGERMHEWDAVIRLGLSLIRQKASLGLV